MVEDEIREKKRGRKGARGIDPATCPQETCICKGEKKERNKYRGEK